MRKLKVRAPSEPTRNAPPLPEKEAARTSLNSGTRHRRCRCSLPGLTGFTTSRRGETDASHHGTRSVLARTPGLAERVGFEPTNTR